VAALIQASREAARGALQERLMPRSAGVRPEAVMSVLAKMLPADAIVAADASYATNWVATYLPARSVGERFLLPRGLAGLGWGLPLAMGAKIASPASRVVAVVGDGGFAHCWSELEAARRQGIAVTVIVFNNRILGYQKHAEEGEYGASTDACDLDPVDHAQIATACGCLGVTVSSHDEIEAALRAAFAADGPAVIDVITDPAARPPLSLFEGKRP
jgi:acetolactate synthase-1/2/3 large subunit